ncbi:MAG: ABC transporter ATP-binding protein [Chloroflexota bacterium]|nr:ABC transporter ATP-binding protein [Chloroflexota bacterium]
MHFHAEHSLFFERRQPPWVAALGIALTSSVLIINAGARSITLSLIGAGVGALLLLFARARGQRRIGPVFEWILALVVLALLGGLALKSNTDVIVETSVRVLCGVIWVLWLGTQVDWASLRQLLCWLRIPESVVASLDHALMHGVLTQREWVHRRDAARLRLGSRRLPLTTWGPLLGEGVLHAFERLESVEENAILRSASCGVVRTREGVHLDAVHVERGGQLVLEQLKFSLGSAEWLLVCGPSGAGKSSLLRLLAGLDAPAQGTLIRLGNHVSPDAALRDRLDGRVAFLGQNPDRHFIASTVAEDIAWGLLRRGIEVVEARRRSREVSVALRIDHLLERPCYQLSVGEQRRVALASLLVLEPALLLLDEPTAGLDPVAAHELCTLVEESVRRTGAACIWATHDLHSLPPQATRVVLLRDRRLIFDGPTVQGLSKPWLIRAGLALSQEGERTC